MMGAVLSWGKEGRQPIRGAENKIPRSSSKNAAEFEKPE